MSEFNVLSALNDVIDVLESGASPEEYGEACVLEKLREARGYMAGILTTMKSDFTTQKTK